MRSRAPALPKDVAAILDRALAFDPAQRFADARVMQQAVRNVAKGAAVALEPVTGSDAELETRGANRRSDRRDRSCRGRAHRGRRRATSGPHCDVAEQPDILRARAHDHRSRCDDDRTRGNHPGPTGDDGKSPQGASVDRESRAIGQFHRTTPADESDAGSSVTGLALAAALNRLASALGRVIPSAHVGTCERCAWLLGRAPSRDGCACRGERHRRRAVSRGQGVDGRGDIARACAQFEESLRYESASGTQLNLADCEQRAGHPARSLALFRAARERLPPGDFRLPFADDRIAALTKQVPELVVRLRADAPADGVRLFCDRDELGAGVAARVDAGTHVIVVQAPARAEHRTIVTLAPGERRLVEIDLAKEDDRGSARSVSVQAASNGRRTAAYVAGGVGVAGVAVGVVVAGILTMRAASTYKEHCVAGQCDATGLDAASSGRTLEIASRIGFAVGAVGLGAGAWLWFTAPSPDSPRAGISVGWPLLMTARGLVRIVLADCRPRVERRRMRRDVRRRFRRRAPYDDGGIGVGSSGTTGSAGSSSTSGSTTSGSTTTSGTGGTGGSGGMSTPATAIAAGGLHACAIVQGGRVKCWGMNKYGQLGSGTTDSASPIEPAAIGAGSVAIAIGAGAFHSCAVLEGGKVTCWGDDSNGQLGDGTALASGFTQVTGGDSHTCAITTDGGVKCWGSNSSGQLGSNAPTGRAAVVVPGVTSVTAITSGSHFTCALAGGGVQCWGSNFRGSLGIGSSLGSMSKPSAALGLASGIVAVSAADTHACAVKMGGGVACWGSNSFGELGFPNPTEADHPIDVPALDSIRFVSLGGDAVAKDHSCAVTSANDVMCWGINGSGQLGRNATPLGGPVPSSRDCPM